MILNKYLFKEIFKVQLVTLIVLMSVFLCQTTIKFISKASMGRIPSDIVAWMIGYSVPSIAFLMLPLTLFAGILIALGRISSDSEMVVMRSVGFSTATVMKICLALSVITAGVSVVNNLNWMPQAAMAQRDMMHKADRNPQFIPLESGRFINFGNAYNAYVDTVSENEQHQKNMGNIYLMVSSFSHDNIQNQRSMIMATSGQIVVDAKGMQWLELYDGNRYEGPLEDGSFRMMHFEKVSLPTDVTRDEELSDNNIATVPTSELWEREDLQAKVELQWRLVPVFGCFILTMVAMPLSLVNPRQGRFARLIPAIGIYVAYYVLALSVRNMMNAGNFPVYPGLYLVPVVFFLLVVLPLNVRTNKVRRRNAS